MLLSCHLRIARDFSRSDWVRFLGWCWFFGSVLFLVIGVRYFDQLYIQSTHAWVYLVAAGIGHFSALALLILVVCVPIALTLPYRLIVLPFCAALLLSGLFLLVLDTFVYGLYRFHLSGFVWEFLVSSGAGEVISISGHTKFVVAITLLGSMLIVGSCIVFAIMLTKHKKIRGIGKYLIFAWLFAWITSQAMHVWYEAHYDSEVAGINRHLPAYYPITAKRKLLKLGLLNPDNIRPDNALLTKAAGRSLRYPLNPINCQSTNSPKNVLVVAIESLRADMWTNDVLPNLTDIEKSSNAQFFSRHISGGNVTKGGIFSLFYGLPAHYWDTFAAAGVAPLWIRQHQKTGYQIGIFSSATLISPAFDRTVFASIPDLRLHTIGNSSAERDLQSLNEFQAFVNNRDDKKPFFGFLFLDASHSYDVPAGYEIFQPQTTAVDHAKLDKEFDPVPFMNRYRNSLVFIDDQIGKLVGRLRDDNILKDTVVIITSDHGEQFNDLGQNFWGHGSNFTAYQVHVPLLILWPGKTTARHDYITSHYDIAPTILEDVMGCVNKPVDYAIGGNLFDADFPRPWVMVSSYYNYGLVLENRLIVTYPFGQYDVRDLDNKLLDDQSMESGLARQVMAVLSRYSNSKSMQ